MSIFSENVQIFTLVSHMQFLKGLPGLLYRWKIRILCTWLRQLYKVELSGGWFWPEEKKMIFLFNFLQEHLRRSYLRLLWLLQGSFVPHGWQLSEFQEKEMDFSSEFLLSSQVIKILNNKNFLRFYFESVFKR